MLRYSDLESARKDILPYLISIIILRLALSIPSTIALESTLSYLGLGLGNRYTVTGYSA